MSLVECPECGVQVSSRAQACPNCGYPFGAISDLDGGAFHVTTERTAKIFKARQVTSILLVVLGLGLLVGTSAKEVGVLFLLIGAVVALVNKVQIWWHHG